MRVDVQQRGRREPRITEHSFLVSLLTPENSGTHCGTYSVGRGLMTLTIYLRRIWILPQLEIRGIDKDPSDISEGSSEMQSRVSLLVGHAMKRNLIKPASWRKACHIAIKVGSTHQRLPLKL